MSHFQSCCCPCFLLGNITTKLVREKPFTIFSCCPQGGVGLEGCQMCCYTCCLSLPGWPIAPCCLSWHLSHLRYKLNLFYESDERLKRPSTLRQQFYLCCCWAVDLSEQHQFVSNLFDEGDLTFKWDFDLYRDQLRSRPVLPIVSMVLVTSSSSASTLFKTKLMQAAPTRHSALDETQQAQLLPMNRGLELDDVQHVSTTVRTVSMPINKDNKLDDNRTPIFLELWQMPPSRAGKASLLPVINDATMILYLLDPLEGVKALADLTKAFKSHRRQMIDTLGRTLSDCEDRQLVILLSTEGLFDDDKAAEGKQKKVRFDDDEDEVEDEENSENSHSDLDNDDDTDNDNDSKDGEHDKSCKQRQPFSPSGRPLPVRKHKSKRKLSPESLLREAKQWVKGEDISDLLEIESGEEEEDKNVKGIETTEHDEKGPLLISTKHKHEDGKRKSINVRVRNDEEYRDILRNCLGKGRQESEKGNEQEEEKN
jgi:hypothetical protein